MVCAFTKNNIFQWTIMAGQLQAKDPSAMHQTNTSLAPVELPAIDTCCSHSELRSPLPW